MVIDRDTNVVCLDHYLWSMFFFHGDVDTSVEPTASMGGDDRTLILSLRRLGSR